MSRSPNSVQWLIRAEEARSMADGMLDDDESGLAMLEIAGGYQMLAEQAASIEASGIPIEQDTPSPLGNWNSVWRQFRRWCLSGVWDIVLQALADSGGDADALQMIDSTTVRAHRCAAGERGVLDDQALGRSRGGFTTKTHLRCNADGLAIGAALSAGEAHDNATVIPAPCSPTKAMTATRSVRTA
jgi:transposase